jgi:hypothetical protein
LEGPLSLSIFECYLPLKAAIPTLVRPSVARSAFLLSILVLAPAVLAAQTDSTGPSGLRFHLPDGSLPTLRIPVSHRMAASALRPDPAGAGARWDAAVRRSVDSGRVARQEGALLRALYGQSTEAAGGEGEAGLLGLGRNYVDLSLDGSAGLYLRSDRLKNHRCTPSQLQDPNSGCQGRITAPRLDSEFQIQAGGVLGRRLNVDVDYDNTRDFNANNDIRIFYQGLQDEIVQRVEFGTVTFDAPSSRFITAAVPAYSFGINSRFEIGALTVGALAASQKGSAMTERTYVVGATTSQPQDRALRDIDFEQGRFFWVVDPTLIPGYPALDILNIPSSAVPSLLRPREVRVYRHRPIQSGGINPNLGGITAVGFRPDTSYRTGAVQWVLLTEGQDYAIDPSGLWIAFANRLDAGDFLAVSYRTDGGAEVGTFPSVDDPAANDSLLLVAKPNQEAGFPTFRHEMRQVYRIAGTDLDRRSLQVDLMLNRSERPASGGTTFLGLLGLAIPTDQDVIDVDNRVYPRPRPRDPLAQDVLRESYVIFPHLQPFGDATKLSSTELVDSLYKTPLYLLFTQGPPARFQFRLQYNAAGGTSRNVIELNAFQIRPESEQILVGGRILERGVDYSVSYELGQVTFLDPDALFGTGQTTVVARFEERGIFAVAPTTIYGLTSTYRVGDAGTFNFIGIYQQENTVFNRPPVGFEPTANLVGGLTGEFRFRPSWATAAMDKLVTGGTTAPSTLDLSGEFAFTAPQANRAGQAYLEEFEGQGGFQVSLRENVWGFASSPSTADGVAIPGFELGFDSADAVQATWQNLRAANSSGTPVQVRPEDIDSLIRITGGTQSLETVLYMTLHADTAGGFLSGSSNESHWSLPERPGRPRYRSIATSLSSNGADLSQVEYVEFWAYQQQDFSADGADLHLVVDLGTVDEDALSIAPESLTVTPVSGGPPDSTWTGRRYAGVKRLDSERQQTGSFNAALDDNGILIDRPDSLYVNGALVEEVATCKQVLTAVVNVYFWGDLGVRCTNGNGSLDTEDLNGDNVLNSGGALENATRYVVDLNDPKYFVRNGGTGWRLYRVPLRDPGAVLIGTPNMRLVQHLRITLAAPAVGSAPDQVAKVGIARMRFVGSPWVRRSDAPVLGLAGATAEPHGEVLVSTVSTENGELGYESPPGVVDQAGRADAVGGTQVNERSLRILGRDLHQGERAEAYFRFVAGPQNLLKYRALHLWMRGRGAGWSDGRLQGVFKVASDERNFYAYRTGAETDTWLPEVAIELETWRELRAEIEERWLNGEAPSGSVPCGAGDPDAYVACDGPYLVQVADPGINPPNLASVQEMDLAVYYAGTGTPISEAELWIDDIRLVDPINAIGTAAALSARLAAADVADFSFGYVRRDGNFQQIGQDPTFLTTATAQFGMSVRADRFLPRALGIALPVSVGYTRSNTDPILVTGTDLRAEDLDGLRRPSASQVTVGASLRRSGRGSNWLTRGLIDPVGLNGSYSAGSSQTELSDAKNVNYSAGLSYNLNGPRRGPKLPLDGLVAALPGWLENSPVGEGMRGSILGLWPTSIRMNSGLTRNEYNFTSYGVVVARPDDSLRTPTLNLSHLWRNSAGLTLQPLGMLTLNGDLSSIRDLRHYPDSTTIGRVVAAERQEFLGIDVGVERDRALGTTLSLMPQMATWFRPRWSRVSGFSLARNLTSREPVRVDEDSGAFILPQTYGNSQSNEIGAGVDLNRLVAIIAGDSSGTTRFLRRLRPLDASVRRSRSSAYDLATFDPSLGYMLALGGLDDFLTQEGEPALGVTETKEGRIGGGADFPGGLSVTLSLADITTQRFTLVDTSYSEGSTRQFEWPQGTARWSRVLRSGPLASIGTGFTMRRRKGTTENPSSTGIARTSSNSTAMTPDLLLVFRSGLSMNVSYAITDRVDQNGANTTRNDQGLLTGSVAQTFRLPASISASRRPMRASVSGQHIVTTTCLQLAASATTGCRNVADVRRLALNGGLTGELFPMAEAGLNVQYVSNDTRHTNQKTSQLALTLSLRIQLTSSDLR